MPTSWASRSFTANKFGTYCIPDGYGRDAVRTIERGEVYEPLTIAYLQGFKRIVHAGAHFGDFLPALKQAEIIWAFEPEPVLFECAQETIRINNLTNIKLYNAALSDRNGTDTLICKTKAGKPLSTLTRLGVPRQPRQGIEVETMTIDSLDIQPDVIHLDIEGGEAKALEGAVETLKHRPSLLLETVPDGYGILAKLELNSICSLTSQNI